MGTFYVLGYLFHGHAADVNELTDVPGVYLVCTWSPHDGQYHCLDVGESEEIVSRLLDHERRPCWLRNRIQGLYYSYHWMPDSTQAQRRAVEARIRAYFNPPCGDR